MLPHLGHSKVTQREFHKYGKNEYLRALNASYTSELLMGFWYSIVWTPIWSWYETLNFKDRRGVASLRYRNRAEIISTTCEQKLFRYVFPAVRKLSFIIWTNKEWKEQLAWLGWEEKKSKTSAFSIYICGEMSKWERTSMGGTRRPYCPRRRKWLCFTTLYLVVKKLGARLDR